MKKTIIKAAFAALAILATSAANAETSLLLFGASHHFDTKGQSFNESNLGAGLEWSPEGSNWMVGAFALRDSLRKFGGSAFVGYRVRHEFESGFHVEATLRAGWLKDAEYNGPAALPSIGVGYGRITIEATYIPKIGSNKVPAAVVWARIKF
ncbi:hypothetical protein [Cupriavidus metallidurans]